ncbi:uncharacterized protein LOC133523989 [Cydia pomonella]|uniref:uncharacterized protein LOC133523989 n=1 Tax=Cydia pomonella TaxID=82600 RepID=UPI002ADD3543|nr:uncharacterized protein LOC133523989 [Cydia pomonella]
MLSFIKTFLATDQNVVNVFKPIYILLSILGLFPYTIKFPKGKHAFIITRKTFILHSLCGLVMFAFLCFNCFYKFKLLTTALKTHTTKNLITHINYFIGIFSRLICDVALYYYTVRNAKNYVNILQEIAFLWSELVFVNVKPIMQFLLKRLVLAPVLWFMFFLIFRLEIYYAEHNKFGLGLFLFLPEMVTSLVVIFYSSQILLVVGLLKNIEMHCKMLVNMKHGVCGTDSNDVDNRNLFNHLELTYVKALELKRKIGKAFETPLAAIIILCFHTALRNTHTMYHGLVISKTINYHKISERSFWLVYPLAKIYVLAYAGNQLQNEVSKIGETLHNIPIGDQERLCLEVQHFTTLMSFHKPQITIYDYFALDITLFFSIMTGLVTYVLLLVQFDSPPNSTASGFTFVGFRECCL